LAATTITAAAATAATLRALHGCLVVAYGLIAVVAANT